MLQNEVTCPNCQTIIEIPKHALNDMRYICPDCLSSVNIPDRVGEALKWVTVHYPDNTQEMEAIKTKLQQEGLDVQSKKGGARRGGASSGGRTGFSVLSGPVQIQTTQENARKAKRVVSEFLSEQEQNRRETIPEYCPTCHSATQWRPECPVCGWDLVKHPVSNTQTDGYNFRSSREIQKSVNLKILFSTFFCAAWLWGAGAILGIFFSLEAFFMIKAARGRLRGQWLAMIGLSIGFVEILYTIHYWFERL